MTIKIGINGLGRIGRMVIRSLAESKNKNIEIKHINNRTKYFINKKDGYKSEKGTMRNTNPEAMINQITYWAEKFNELYDYISFENKSAKDIINENEYVMNINLSLHYLNELNQV